MPLSFRIVIALSLLPLCTVLAELNDKRIEFYHGIAEGNYLIGDLQGAAKGVEQMLKIDADYVPALTLSARIDIDRNQPERALVSAERAQTLEPEVHAHTLLKALVLGSMTRREDAIRSIEQVMQVAPAASDDYRVASKLLGLLLMAEGDWDTAADTFNQIYSANPQTAAISLELASEAYLEKAANALNSGDTDTAVTAITQALEAATNQPGENSLKQQTTLRMMRGPPPYHAYTEAYTAGGMTSRCWPMEMPFSSCLAPDFFRMAQLSMALGSGTTRSGLLSPLLLLFEPCMEGWRIFPT